MLVYGLTEHPMMLATNKDIKSKEDVIAVAKQYFSRWKIEEYFRCKKQMFQFENFRVQKLYAINTLNFYITLCMAFLAHISMKSETNALKVSIIQKADPVKKKVYFCYYRLAKGISGILSYAKEGVRLWFRTKRPAYRQLCLKLTAYRSIPEYPVTFYDINHFFMYAACLFWREGRGLHQLLESFH